MKELNVGVIGCGSLGQHHARIYHELPMTNLVAICDPDKSKKERADEYGAEFHTDFNKLIGSVKAVSIATPTALHYKIAKEMLSRDIHVLIEKPITNNLSEADELIALARKRNLFMRVGHIERFNAAYRTVKKIARRVKFIEVHRLGPFTPRVKDCGVVLDLMIHDIDIILSLLQSEVTFLDAVGVHVLTKHEDIANVRIKFANGATANLTASRLTPEKQRKIRIWQDDAYMSVDYQKQSASIYRKELFNISKKEIDIAKEEPLKAELENFAVSVLKNSNENRVDVDARNALEVALKILDSIAENTKLIK